MAVVSRVPARSSAGRAGRVLLNIRTRRALPDAAWIAQLNSPSCAVFGLFDAEHLVGITAVFTDREDPSGQTAVLAMSFILPDYRGRGLSTLLYDARLAWARARPQFRRVLVGHRASNEASRKANQRHGFKFLHQRPHVWPDGGAEDEWLYELALTI